MPITLAFANQKGGVGKTTLAFHLAHLYSHDHGRRVLAVDMDPQGNLTQSLLDQDFPQESNISLIFEGQKPKPIPVLEKLDLVPADLSLSVHEKNLVLSNYFRLKTFLSGLDYDLILIDCPPSLGLFTINALVATRWVVTPVDISAFSIRGLRDLQDSIQEVQSTVGSETQLLGVVISGFSRRHLASRAIIELLETEYRHVLFETRIPQSTKVREAMIAGVPVWEIVGRRHPVSQAMERLAQEILERMDKERPS